MKIILIGATEGSLFAVERIRRIDERAEILLFDEEEIDLDISKNFPYCIHNNNSLKEGLLEFQKIFQVDIRKLSKVETIDSEVKCIGILNLKNGVRYREKYDKLIITKGKTKYSNKVPVPDSDKIVLLGSNDKKEQLEYYLTEFKPKQVLVCGSDSEAISVTDILCSEGCKVVLTGLGLTSQGMLDQELNYIFYEDLRTMGVDVITRNPLREITLYQDMLAAHFYKMGIAVDMVVICSSETPYFDDKMDTYTDGSLVVNEQMESSLQDVYVIGSTAKMVKNYLGKTYCISLNNNIDNQCKTAVDHIYGKKSRYSGSFHPVVMKCGDVYAAKTGKLEQELRADTGYEKDYTLVPYYEKEVRLGNTIIVKLIFEKYNGKLIGAQFLGRTDISGLCNILTAALRAEFTVEELTALEQDCRPCYLSTRNPIQIAGLSALDIINRFVRVIHWDQISKMPQEQFLDVRTQEEQDCGTIKGAVNIPLEELRERMEELNKARPVYVFSQYGDRGSLACRILSQNGFDCFNLSGGFAFYNIVNVLNTSKD